MRQPIGAISPRDFETVRRLALDACGISLHEGKISLVSSRLERLVRKYRFGGFGEYVEFLAGNRGAAEFSEFIDTLTTNHSGFWREPEHFTFLMDSILAERTGSVRIWSAACATGEEPYNIAMCCLERSVTAHIEATDISGTALKTAAVGEYDRARVEMLPMGWRDRYFSQRPSGRCLVTPLIRAGIRFSALNLLQPLPPSGRFDVIFCRNVMIYFEQATRDALVARLIDQLLPGGYLFTGHSETLLRLPAGLTYVRPATYRRNG